MARPYNFVGIPFTLGGIDLYCKHIITPGLHIDWTILWIYNFFRDRNEYHVTTCLALNRIAALIRIFSWNTLRCAVVLFCCKVLQKIYKKNFEIHLSLFCYWTFWHDVTAAILVYQEDLLEVEIFSYVNASFSSNKLA